MDFKAIGPYTTGLLTKAAGVTIEAGDLVALASGLAIKATATSARVAFCPSGAVSAALVCEATIGQVRLKGDASDVFAAAQRGLAYDIAVSGGGKQTINQSGTTYKPLMMNPKNSGVVGAEENVDVMIVRPLESFLYTVI